MKIDGIAITFESGRTQVAWYGIIGLGTDGLISTGYDARIVQLPSQGAYLPREGDPSSQELIELSDMMIARWTALRERLQTSIIGDAGTPSGGASTDWIA